MQYQNCLLPGTFTCKGVVQNNQDDIIEYMYFMAGLTNGALHLFFLVVIFEVAHICSFQAHLEFEVVRARFCSFTESLR